MSQNNTAPRVVPATGFELLDAVASPTCAVDESGVVRHWNHAMVSWLNIAAVDAVGRPLREVVPLLAGPEVEKVGCLQNLAMVAERPAAWQAPDEMAACLRSHEGVLPQSVWLHPFRDDKVVTTNTSRRRAVWVLTVDPTTKAAARNEGLALLRALAPELRTPLVGVLTHADLLADADLPQERRHECLATIRQKAATLRDVLDGLLQLADLEVGDTRAEREVADPRAWLREQQAGLELTATQRGVGFELMLEPSVPARVETDLNRLLDILRGLVDFTADGAAKAAVRMEARGSATEFTVSVRGVAAADAAHLERWFDPAGGRGPSLALHRAWAARLGGALTVERELDGSGGFRLTVPIEGGIERRAAVPSKGAAPAPALATAASSNAAAAVPPRPAVPVSGCGRVLLAEDGPDQGRLVAGMLRKAGWDVMHVANGQAVLDEVERASRRKVGFDVILMDMCMPEMDGFEATRRLRSQGYDGSILALASNPISGDKQRSFAAGCDGFTAKPVERTTLIQMVQRAVLARL